MSLSISDISRAGRRIKCARRWAVAHKATPVIGAALKDAAEVLAFVEARGAVSEFQQAKARVHELERELATLRADVEVGRLRRTIALQEIMIGELLMAVNADD